MNITSAKFVKGLVGPDEILTDGIAQIAFVGRSNVGKSSLINSLTGQKALAKTSSFPGHTQEVNVFKITASGGKNVYFVDLPGYGFAKASKSVQEGLQQLIYWYLLGSNYAQKVVVLIVDANVGVTETDYQMLHSLKQKNKNVIVVANKMDKLKKSEVQKKLKEIQGAVGEFKVILYSSEKKIGLSELSREIFK